MATSGKQVKKEHKRHIPAKTSFMSPFSSKWSPLSQEDMHFILKTLKDKMISTGLEKKEEKVFRPWRKKKERKLASTSEPLPQESQDVKVRNPTKNGWTDVAARRQLAIGINEVTKALERNELQLLLVCKSARPKHMTNHLMALSATRGVPACQVPRLSQSVSEPLGLKSVLALGFRQCSSKEDEMFSDTIDAIKPRVPSLHVMWLQSEAPKVTSERPADIEEDGGIRGQKRKLERESEKVADVPSSSSMLQPLQVKRIVPNPAKKRKVKSKTQPEK